MGAVKGNKPIFHDKEGNVSLAVFKNKNTRGSIYPVICITINRFPFRYSQKLYITLAEFLKIANLHERFPELKIKQPKNLKKFKLKLEDDNSHT